MHWVEQLPTGRWAIMQPDCSRFETASYGTKSAAMRALRELGLDRSGAPAMADEFKPKPGWLAEDAARAAKRVQQMNFAECQVKAHDWRGGTVCRRCGTERRCGDAGDNHSN